MLWERGPTQIPLWMETFILPAAGSVVSWQPNLSPGIAFSWKEPAPMGPCFFPGHPTNNIWFTGGEDGDGIRGPGPPSFLLNLLQLKTPLEGHASNTAPSRVGRSPCWDVFAVQISLCSTLPLSLPIQECCYKNTPSLIGTWMSISESASGIKLQQT